MTISKPMKPLVKLVNLLTSDTNKPVRENFVRCGRWQLEFYDGYWYVYDHTLKQLSPYPYWGKEIDKAMETFEQKVKEDRANA